jgi:hypothetical protein
MTFAHVFDVADHRGNVYFATQEILFFGLLESAIEKNKISCIPMSRRTGRERVPNDSRERVPNECFGTRFERFERVCHRSKRVLCSTPNAFFVVLQTRSLRRSLSPRTLIVIGSYTRPFNSLL